MYSTSIALWISLASASPYGVLYTDAFPPRAIPDTDVAVAATISPWSELRPDAEGRYMVLDHGRWRWHDLQELGDRD